MEEMFPFAVGFLLVFVVIAVFVSLSKQEAARKKRERKEQGKERRRKERHLRDLERQREVHKEFLSKFEQQQQAIGKIECPQCGWTGNWGDGMSYQEYFAYELHVKHKVKIDETLIRDANNLSSESQYKCPMCKSTNWQKV